MAGNQGGPITTIPPFANQQLLPACATSCDPLHAANGACVPPAVAQGNADSYEACFCARDEVKALSSTTSGVCDNVCQADGVGSIATWFRDLCSVDSGGNDNNNGGNGNGNGDDNGDGDKGSGGSSGSSSNSNDDGGGGDWLSNHWQWVVMLCVLVVAIAGIWVGACIWRRRYLKKKERQATWSQKQSGSASRPSWGPGEHESQVASRPQLNTASHSDDSRAPGVFMPESHDSGNVASEKSSSKKRWFVKERT